MIVLFGDCRCIDLFRFSLPAVRRFPQTLDLDYVLCCSVLEPNACPRHTPFFVYSRIEPVKICNAIREHPGAQQWGGID